MTRSVRSVEHEGKPAKAVIASRVFDTDPEDLWDALTTPARLRRWFMPISGELKLGGRYQLEGNASGTITACERPRYLAVTWEFGGGTSWVRVSLAREGAGTQLELQHIAYVEEHWTKFGPGAVGVGWDLGFLGLAQHLHDPERALRPEDAEAWMATPEAKDLVRTASTDWGRAAIADGEPEDAARAAAERTRAFYSGEA